MISEQYINEGIRIRTDYIKNLNEILKYEPEILNKKNLCENIQKDMETIVFSDKNSIMKQMELNSKLILLEKEIKYIQDKIKPFYNNIEKLMEDSDKLYLSIREKYPNITNKQIEQNIMSKIKE